MILPQKNAELAAVGRGGASEDYDTAPGGAPAVWNGKVDAYVGERRATMVESQGLNVDTISFAIVPGDLGVNFEAGDVLTLFNAAGVSYTRTVREVRDRQIDVLPAQPIRLDLEDV